MRNFLFAFLTLLILNCTPAQQEDPKPDYSSAIDSTRIALLAVMDSTDIPGLAVAVMVEGEMVYSEGFGYSDLEQEIPVDPSSTLFRIGSVSKSFTSLAIGKLFEEGKLDIDKPIQEYVPYFPEKKWPITTRQVAGHIAGIRHYRGNEVMSNTYYATVREGLDIFKDDTLLFEPGTNYRYSSYGWNLVSAIVEGASGEEFLNYMDNEIFGPLEISTIKADLSTEDIPGRTKFYYYDDSLGTQVAPDVDNSYKWAGGGYIATVQGMAEFGNSLLYPSLISKETVDLLITSQTINDTLATNYGMGWFSGAREDGREWFGHSGGSVGGITQLVIYPESKTVVGLTSNSSDVRYRDVHHRIVRWFELAAKVED